MKEVYSRVWFMGKKEGPEKYKENSSWIQGENKCRSKTTGENGYGRKKRL